MIPKSISTKGQGGKFSRCGRAGGMGMISGRQTFQRPRPDGVELFTAIRDVFLSQEITVA
jgi:DhnA family fructose-bisphosphate aldolase class Ia